MELRKKQTQGCNFEVIDSVTDEVKIAKHNNGSCFNSANNYPDNSIILNIYEPKANIDLSLEDIERYIWLINSIKPSIFLKIEFIPNYNELEYKFIVKKPAKCQLAKFKGTYTVIRYLWGDGKPQNFDIIPRQFLDLVNKYPTEDLFSLLQLAHNGLPQFYNTNHCLLEFNFKLLKSNEIKFSSNDMNITYSGDNHRGSLLDTKNVKPDDIIKSINEPKLEFAS